VRRARPAAIATALVVLIAGCSGKNAVDQSAGGQFRFVSGTSLGKVIPAADRKKAGAFTDELLDGGTYRLADQAGKVVVINFWATWCGPCTTETPQFDAVYRANQAKGVTFLGVDTKETSRDAARAFVHDNAITYPIVWDEPGQTAVALGKVPALSLPFTVLVDRQQRVAAVYLHVLTAKDLQPVVDTLAAES
jgi:peroxiredoxin